MHPEYVKILKQSWVFVLPFSGYMLGKFLDDKETERMVRFRDKSSLYGRILGPDDKPSWPSWQT